MPKRMLRHYYQNRFFRFLVIGGINTLFGYTSYALLLFAGLHYAAAVAIATVAGVMFNYLTTGRLVFGYSGRNRLLRFCGVYILLYCVNTTALWLFNQAGFNLYLAGAILILPMALLGYSLNRVLVFS